jgi:hypothetical protein
MKLHPAFTQSSLSSLPAAANRSGHQVDKKSPFYLPPNAMDQFWHDTAGVYVPKIPTWRSHIQAFKDTFLEFVEDGAFYFSIPLMGPLLARAYVDIQKLEPMLKKHAISDSVRTDAKGTALEWLGTPYHILEKNIGDHIHESGKAEVLAKIAKSKVGVLVGAVAFASGLEYSIQHTNNLLTAKFFHAKNFTATAGLEAPTNEIRDGEVDVVARGKKRLKQVGLVTGALMIGSFVLPALLKGKGIDHAQKILRYVDFSAQPNQKIFYDLSKPLLALVIGTGIVSYLDAAQNDMERKEVAARLAIVAPYLLVGGELTRNGLAWLAQNKMIVQEGKKLIIGDGKNIPKFLKTILGHDKADGVLGLNFLKEGRNVKQSLTQPEHFLDMNFLKNDAAFQKMIDTAQKEGRLSADNVRQINRAFDNIDAQSNFIKIFGMGISTTLLTYAITRERFKAQKEKEFHEQKSKNPEQKRIDFHA